MYVQNSIYLHNVNTVNHGITISCRVLYVQYPALYPNSFTFELFKEKYTLIKCFYFQRLGKFTPLHFRDTGCIVELCPLHSSDNCSFQLNVLLQKLQ